MTEEIQKDKRNSQALLLLDRVMDTIDMVLSQFTSGRWLLTVVAGVVMLRICWVQPEKIFEFKEIIAVIIYAYFQRNDRQGGKDEKVSTGTGNSVNPDAGKG